MKKVLVEQLQRYSKNPFLSRDLPIKTKKVFVSQLGANTWINQTTGEIGGTHLVKYKEVDSEKFVKLFAENIGLTFALSAAGIKAFNVLIWALQKQKDNDLIQLSKYVHEDWQLEHPEIKNFSYKTFSRGLTELVKNQIIAKSIRYGFYFINPHFVFNGKRVAFTTVLEIKEKTDHDRLEELSSKRMNC